MKIIICLDDHDGMLFHKRRQSMDRNVHKNMIEHIGQNQLWMSQYSYKSFATVTEQCHADDNFWELAKADDFCFVEDSTIAQNLHLVNEIVIYRWNRIYPADVKFQSYILDNWNLVETESFAGYSHEQITKEVYRR